MSKLRRIFTVGNFLRFVITLMVLGAVALLAVVGGDHLVGQIEAGSELGSSQGVTLFRLEGVGESEGFRLETLEDTALGVYLRLNQERLESPADTDVGWISFTVEPGETATTITDRLEEQGVVMDAQLFRLYMRYTGVDAKLEAGQFRLSSDMSMVEIARQLQSAQADEIVVTIPEGMRAEEVADLLTAQDILDGQRFLELVQSGDPADAGLGSYGFLAGLPSGASLEGFLFPDTYRLLVPAQPEELLERMLDNFDAQITPDMRSAAADSGRSLYEVVTLASVVAREALLAEEEPLIASVYLNRLAEGMFMRADPTVQYAMGYQTDTGLWWKTPVTLEEYTEVDSEYNTYLYPGLPPGPICSPGFGAIEGSIYPSSTEYLYFMATGDGGHAFAVTYEEHEANVEKYQQ